MSTTTASGETTSPHTLRLERWGAAIGPALIAIAGVVMLWWTWRRWPDVLTDFGRELYLAWRLSEGEVLYADLAYTNGPLSPYWNALMFRLFGVSLLTIAITNVVLFAILVALVYRLIDRSSGGCAATVAGLTLVGLFGFAQLIPTGNYNFVTPYSHDLTHGVLLAIVALACLDQYLRGRRLSWLFAMGTAVGLTFLTKVEVFAASASATLISLVLTIWIERPTSPRRFRMFAVSLAGAIIPAAITAIAFLVVLPLERVVAGPLGHWQAALNRELVALPYFRSGMGTDAIAANLQSLLRVTLWYSAVLLPAGALAIVVRRPRLGWGFAALMLIGVCAGLRRWPSIPWQDLPRPLPLLMAMLAVVCLISVIRIRRDVWVMRFGLVLFALAMLLKISLNVRLYHYGFALAMPATLMLIVALVGWAADAITRRGGSGIILTAAVLAVLGTYTHAHLTTTGQYLRLKTTIVGAGRDAFFADPGRGDVINATVAAIGRHLGPASTLAALPEGAIINYLARRVNPSPYSLLLPVEMILNGEAAVLAAMQARPADYVLMVHRNTAEFGSRFFGTDYGRTLATWISANYHPVELIGAKPFESNRFGIQLLQHNGAPSAGVATLPLPRTRAEIAPG